MIKQVIKQVLLAIAAVLIVGSPLATEAADSLPPLEGNLFIHKYYMDDIAEAGLPNDGQLAAQIPESAVPLPGVTFDLYKIKPIDGRYPEGKSLVVDADKLTVTDEGIAYRLERSVSVQTNSQGTAEASGLPQGSYVAVERPVGTVTLDGKEMVVNPSPPFVVHVPLTNPSGTGWLSDVHVYPKNEGIVVGKIVATSRALNIGGTVSYLVHAKVPAGVSDDDATINSAIRFTIQDMLEDALSFLPDSLKVYQSDQITSTGTDLAELSAGQDYDVVRQPDISIHFTESGRRKLSKKKYVLLAFDSILNTHVLANERPVVANTAKLIFVNKNGVVIEKQTLPVDIHTGIIEVTTVSAQQLAKLSGASFQIASSKENAQNKRFMRKDDQGRVIDFNETGYEEAESWVETTNAEGHTRFEGIRDYLSTADADGEETISRFAEYWLVQTKAPAGYHLLDQPVLVTFDEESSTGEQPIYTISTQIKNSKKGLLPRTGSIGAIVLSVLGIVVIGASVIFFILTGRKERS